MKQRLLCAGFGGQGALLIGKIVVTAGMLEGKHVTWLPSYGPEMRGGTANVMAVISDKPVGSPIFTRIDTLVALNQPSLDKFLPQVVEGGIVLYNSDLCDKGASKNGVRIVGIPLNKFGEQVGDIKASNMVALGALVELTGCVENKTVQDDLTHMLEKKNPTLLARNLEALELGRKFVAQAS
jgi:2-oxoglutarate ferredoxin oxidoreductase subunit gamma